MTFFGRFANIHLLHMTVAIGLIVTVCVPARAQQTIFNVPSQDVLSKGEIYSELDAPFRMAAPKYLALTPRIVTGLGENMEGGVNLPGYLNVGENLWTAIVVLKRGERLDDSGTFTLTYGAHAYIPLTSGRQLGLFGYLTAGKKWGSLRIAAGGYGASSVVTGTENTEVGALGSIELALTDWMTVATDAYSGKNALSFITPGLVILPFANASIYPAYEFSTIGRDGDSFLIEFGYTFGS